MKQCISLPDETIDVIEGVQIIQKKKVHRVTTDSLLLARFSNPKRHSSVLEIGTGCGIVSILLTRKDPTIKITAVEIEKDMAALAERNVSLNGLGSQITVLNKDIKELPKVFPSASFDYVVVNPPYRAPSSGRISQDGGRSLSRKEVSMTLKDLLKISQRLLKIRGRLSLVYIAERLVDLFTEMRTFRIEPKTLTCIGTGNKGGISLIWVEGVREGRPGLRVKREY